MNSQEPNSIVSRQVRQLVWMWTFCSFSPLIYFALSWILRNTYFAAESGGFIDLSRPAADKVFYFFLLVIPICQYLLFTVYRRYRQYFSLYNSDEILINLLKKRTMLLLLISEIPGISGFFLFLFTGNLRDIFVLGLFSLLSYAQSHPTRYQPFKLQR